MKQIRNSNENRFQMKMAVITTDIVICGGVTWGAGMAQW